MNQLAQFGNIPIDYGIIASIFNGYKSPKDKVASLEENGDLIRLKKGLYVVSPKIQSLTISKELIANHLYGASYVSFEAALSHYGLIPERVYTMRSVTTKRSKTFTTPLGNFDFVTTDGNYFKIGLRQEIVENQYAFLIATPEKALCDLIVSTAGLRLQSTKSVASYLIEDLRIDLDAREKWDLAIIKDCITFGKKKNELTHLYNYLKNDHI